jgi:hypothetical protein
MQQTQLISVCEGGLPIPARRPLMERVMSDFSNSTDREIYGANALTVALIFVTAVLAIAFLAGTSPEMGNHIQAAAHVASISAQQAQS